METVKFVFVERVQMSACPGLPVVASWSERNGGKRADGHWKFSRDLLDAGRHVESVAEFGFDDVHAKIRVDVFVSSYCVFAFDYVAYRVAASLSGAGDDDIVDVD